MAANINPIFPLSPKIGMSSISAANTAKDGTGTVVTIFTAGNNGARVDRLKVRSTGTAVATVLRVFINNGADPTVAANNVLYAELSIAATAIKEAAAQVDNVLTIGLTLPAGYRITCTLGTAVAAALAITCEGGDY